MKMSPKQNVIILMYYRQYSNYDLMIIVFKE